MNFIVYFAVGILAGLGVGSGGLLILYLTLVVGMDIFSARPINLLFFVFALAFACIVNIFRGRINLRLSLMLIIPGIIGAIVGGLAAGLAGGKILTKLFGIFLIIGGGYSLFAKKG